MFANTQEQTKQVLINEFWIKIQSEEVVCAIEIKQNRESLNM